jgi:hypothetical protein
MSQKIVKRVGRSNESVNVSRTAVRFQFWLVSWALLAMIIMGSVPAHGQLDAGTINGTVTDSTGAVIPGVEVVITNKGTGQSRTTVTNQTGSYSVPSLDPGAYTLTFSKSGFDTSRQEGMTLHVAQVANLNVTLAVGSATQTVEVSASTISLDSTDTSLGTVIHEQQVQDLPLNGRQFSQLLQLAPGTVPIDNSQNAGKAPSFGAGAASPGVDGQTNRSNIFYLDGIIASNPFFGGFSFSPSVDAIQEFKAQSHTDQSEFGQATGAIVSVVARAGTNTFHGGVYWFVRNTSFDATNAFSDTKQPYHLNQFGGSLGGPILKNKLFFFANYEGGRQVITPSANFSTVPTDAQRSGDFSGVLPGNVSPIIYDPSTYDPVTNTESAFPGNKIPNVDPQMLALLNGVYPHANHPLNASGQNNYLATTKNTTFGDQGSIRVDYVIGQSDALTGQYAQNEASLTQPSSLANQFVTGFNGKNTGVTWTHTFNPTLLMDITSGYNNLNIPQGILVAADQDAVFTAAGLGAGWNKNPGLTPVTLIPGYSLEGGNYTGFWNGAGPIGPMHIYQVGGTISKTHGSHNMKFGASYYRTWMYTNWNGNNMDFSFKGTWNAACQFVTAPTAQCPTYDASAGNLGAGGDPVASMLLSAPIDGTRNLGNSGVNLIENTPAIFGQDTWKVSPTVTINYGLRWDYSAPMREANNRLTSYDIYGAQQYLIAKGNVDLPSGPLPANTVVLNRHSITTSHWADFSPRLGIAYQFKPTTVFRIGAGRTFDDWGLPLQVGQQVRGAWPSGLAQQASTKPLNTVGTSFKPDGTPVTGQDPFYGPAVLGASPLPAGGLGFQDTKWVPASSFQWNGEVEQGVGKFGVWSIAYVGAHTTHQTLLQPYNLAAPSPIPLSARINPFPDQVFGGVGQVLRSTAGSNYNALQTKLTKTFSSGLTYGIAYTWSRSLGLSSCNGDFSNICVQNIVNIAQNYGPTDLDVPNIFIANATYQLPFGRGMPHLNTGAEAVIFGGWQLNTIVSLRSGTVINPTNGSNSDTANAGGGNQRVNINGNPEHGAPHKRGEWWNPNVFSLPEPGTYGNASINSLRGPSYRNTDFSVFRNIPFNERVNLQFRFEAFDLFNRPNLGQPNGSFGSGGFNTITSTVPTTGPGANRNIQFALKLLF